ncbi:MAG TPA: DUF4019 domain-containing protein [Usitatibacter sp.]|nr:DUF4019 domain-containing protein [Usitatibacter sp.]
MRKVCGLLVFATAALLAMGALAASGEEALDTKPAMRVAETWLAMVDQGRFDESWEAAATLFQQTIAKDRWAASASAARAPLGLVSHRKLRAATYSRNLPGAPPGEYVVIQFDTRFENRPLSVETVTPMLEKDGTWKVSGYFIR